jgi:transposase
VPSMPELKIPHSPPSADWRRRIGERRTRAAAAGVRRIGTDLREYEQHKFEIAKLLRQSPLASQDRLEWRSDLFAWIWLRHGNCGGLEFSG